MPEPLTAERLAEITALYQIYSDALADIESCDGPEFFAADRKYHEASDQLTAVVPDLLAELTRLREALRWRTVAADGLPEAGVRVLVQTMTAPLEIVTRQRVDFWDDGVLHDAWQISSGERYGTDPADRWLPVPEETP